MLKKLNIILAIIALVGALLDGGYFAYTKIKNTSSAQIQKVLNELGDSTPK